MSAPTDAEMEAAIAEYEQQKLQYAKEDKEREKEEKLAEVKRNRQATQRDSTFKRTAEEMEIERNHYRQLIREKNRR